MTRAEMSRIPWAGGNRVLRHRMRSCADRVAASIGLLAWCERRMHQGLTILMYHRVLPAEQCAGYPLQSLVMPVEAFREQMRWLAGHCRVMPVADALAALQRKDLSDRPLVAVTFDDGYADNHEIAADILEEHQLRATFFVTSDFVEGGEPMWFDCAADAWSRLQAADQHHLLDQLVPGYAENGKRDISAEPTRIWMEFLKHRDPAVRVQLVGEIEERSSGPMRSHLYRPMTPEQVAELHQRGHEIGSHTVTHPLLTQLSEEECRRELKESREAISRWIGEEVAGLCYPNGDFDHRVETVLALLGYRYACTMAAGLNRPNVVPTRLSRLSITMQRTVRGGVNHDELGFRSELSQLREMWR